MAINMLIVRKPFDKIDEPDKIRRNEEHKEKEEKPVAQERKLTSEDYHGGDESTESLPNTPNNSSSSEGLDNSTESNTRQNTRESNGKGDDETSSRSSVKYSSDEFDDSNESSDDKAGETSVVDNDKNENSVESSDDGEGEDKEDEGGDNDEYDENGDEYDNESDEGDGDGDYDAGDEEGEEEGNEDDEYAEDEDGDDNGDESDEGDDDQSHTYQYNTEQAFDFEKPETSTKYYQTEFYRFVEMMAEEKTKIFDPKSSEEFNIKRMMLRPFERKPLNYYRQSKVRDSMVLILDNSGSMDWWAENLALLAELALDREELEAYIAPNGYVEERLVKTGRVLVSHEAIMRALNGRKIIYVGDFDGANTPVELSWRNDVIWICPESRYRKFRSHDWVSYDEGDFKGVFLRVYNLGEMLYALKKLLSYQYINGVRIDLHEDDRFDDD